MEFKKVTTNGQVTIPKTIRVLLGIEPGDQVGFVIENGKVTIEKLIVGRTGTGMGLNIKGELT